MSVLGMMFSVIVGTGGAPVQIENCQVVDAAMLSIECSVTNLKEVAISQICFIYSASDPSRTIPWIEGDRGVRNFSGGIEPKETIREFFSLGRLSSRASTENLLIEITGITAYGPDGEPLN